MAYQITGATKLFGILADPIHHVQTPQAINRLFEAAGFDGIMVPLHVPKAALPAVVAGLRTMDNLGGFVVTLPHKSAMLALCDEVSRDARQIGAVNVVRRTPEGRLLGTMLDGEGFVTGLRQDAIDPAGCRSYLAGAGGAASAIAFALAKAGVRQLTVANRTIDKVLQLFDRLRAIYPGVQLVVGSGDPVGHDLVINATSLGLHAGDDLPLDVTKLTPEQVVAEIIMDPVETPLLAAAKARGCRVQYGAPMLAGQMALMGSFMTGEITEQAMAA